MADPTSSTAAAVAVAAPAVTIMGVATGLQPAMLLAGFVGAIIALIFMDAAGQPGDTAAVLVRTTIRRALVAAASALVAGYATPILIAFVPALDAGRFGVAAFVGGGAQPIFKALIARLVNVAGGAA